VKSPLAISRLRRIRRVASVGSALPSDLDLIKVRRPPISGAVPAGVTHEPDADARPVTHGASMAIELDHVGTRGDLVHRVGGRLSAVVAQRILTPAQEQKRQRQRAGENAPCAPSEAEDGGAIVRGLDTGDRGARSCADLGADQVRKVSPGVAIDHGSEESTLDAVLDVLRSDRAVDRRREPNAGPKMHSHCPSIATYVREGVREIGHWTGGVARPEPEQGRCVARTTNRPATRFVSPGSSESTSAVQSTVSLPPCFGSPAGRTRCSAAVPALLE
jgi:hypothetical protein